MVAEAADNIKAGFWGLPAQLIWFFFKTPLVAICANTTQSSEQLTTYR